MKMMTPCLMTGPFDWAEEKMPRAEFDARLSRVRAAMRARGVERLVVHGNAFDHGALAWLTNFTPKLGPGFALVSLEGPMRILFSGGPGMKPSAERLTFVEDVAALRGVAVDVAKWSGEQGAAPSRLGLCEGKSIMQQTWSALTGLVADGGAVIGMDAEVNAMRRAKSPREFQVLAKAIGVLDSTLRAFARAHGDKGRRAAMMAAEAAAFSAGAQDARLLLSHKPFGPPAPFDGEDARVALPAGSAVAVRCDGYWAAGQGMFGDAPAQAKASAKEALLDVVARLRAGAPCGDMRAAAPDVAVSGHGIGLSLEDGPRFGGEDALVEGEVCNIVASVKTGEGGACAWSALARVEKDGARLLWAAPDLEIPVARD